MSDLPIFRVPVRVRVRLGSVGLRVRVSVEFAFVVFALVVERVQDTVVRVLGVRPRLVLGLGLGSRML